MKKVTAIVDKEKCHPMECAHECMLYDPINRSGGEGFHLGKEDGKARIEKSYDLYIDRAMIEAEFDTLWQKQATFNPALFNQLAYDDLKDTLLHQRPLKPVKPGDTFDPGGTFQTEGNGHAAIFS